MTLLILAIGATIVGLTMLLMLGVVNRRMRQWTLESPRRESMLRWNFWTLSLAGSGALVRAALAPSEKLTEAQAQLRTGVQLTLGLPLVTFIAYAAALLSIGKATPAMEASFTILSMMTQLPGLYWLSRQLPHLKLDPHMGVVAQKAAVFGLIGASLWGLAIVFAGKINLLAIGVAIVALVFGIRFFLNYMSLAIFISMEMHSVEGGIHARPGARNALIGGLYLAALMLVSLALPQ